MIKLTLKLYHLPVLIKAKLLPPDGPTTSDLNGGLEEGFVDYGEEDGGW